MPEMTVRGAIASGWDRWKSMAFKQRYLLPAALLAMLSPFLPWFHSCLRRPGVYNCQTWNGWQWDNDIFGTLVFLLGMVVFVVTWRQLLEMEWPFSLQPDSLRLIAGGLLVLLGVLRLLTFQGISNENTAIGPNIGLFVTVISGLLILGLQESERVLTWIKQLRRTEDEEPYINS